MTLHGYFLSNSIFSSIRRCFTEVQVTLVTPSNLGDIVTITRMTPADRENLYTNTNFVPSSA